MMRRGNFVGPQRRPMEAQLGRSLDWREEVDPRMEAYYSTHNQYTSGPGAYLAPEQQPYSVRSGCGPFKLFVSNIHPHTTEEGILNMFSDFGIPINVHKFRNRFNEPVAFVDFETQREADSAIIGLDGKPPMSWSVTYANMRGRREDPLAQIAEMLQDDLDRQTPLYPAAVPTRPLVHPSRPMAPPFPPPGEQSRSTAVVTPRSATPSDYPPCIICGEPAKHVCGRCKIRYCSSTCQYNDWPNHQARCIPPPALEPGLPCVGEPPKRVPPPATSTELPPPARAPREVPNLSITRQFSDATGASAGTGLVNPQPSAIRGIQPLAGTVPKIQFSAMNGTTHEQQREIRQQGVNGPASTQRSPGGWKNGHASPRKSTGTSPKNCFACGKPGHMSKECPNNRPAPANGTAATVATTNGGSGRNFPLKTLSIQSPSGPKKQYADTYACSKLEIPPLNKAVPVVVCYAKSPGEIYVHYERYSDNLKIMMKEIQTSAANSPALGPNPAEMSPCLAIFPEDHERMWYRAQVIKVCEDGIGVVFVDFGNRIKLPNTRDNLRQMEITFNKERFYAARIKLADIEPLTGGAWPLAVNEQFKKQTENKPFLMEHVRMEDDVICARMKLEDHRCVNDLVVERGWAKATVCAINQTSSETNGGQTAPLNVLPAGVAQKPPQMPIANRFAQSTTPREADVPMPSQTSQSVNVGLALSPVAQPAASVPARSPAAQPAASVPTRPSATNTVVARFAQPATAATTVPTPEPVAVAAAPAQVPRPPKSTVSALQLLRARQAASAPQRPSTTHSILNEIKVGENVVFSPVSPYKSSHCVGFLIRHDEDASVVENFDELAKSSGTPLTGFNLEVGSVVAALSVEHQQWFRGCVAKVSPSAYSILYIDFGNLEEGVITVKPIPDGFKHPELAVKISFSKELTPEQENQIVELLAVDSLHDFQIISKESDGSAIAKWVGDGKPALSVKLEPWTALLVKPVQPAQREIKARSWAPGFSGEVVVIGAEDLDKICVQEVSDEVAKFTELISKTLMDSFPKSPQLTTIPSVGTYVAAVYPEDGEIYRGLVTGVSGDSISISYIDWGNSDTVSLSQVRALPEELYQYPRCCHRISLHSVSRPSGPLPDAVKDKLNKICLGMGSVLVVNTSDEGMECKLDIGGEIINEVVGNLLKPQASNLLPMPMLEAAEPEPAAPEPAVAEPPANPGDNQDSSQPDNTLGSFSLQDGPFQELPVGKNVQLFTLVTTEGPKTLSLMVGDDIIANKLDQLGVDLATYAESVSRGFTPQSGEICIIRSSEDGHWYRAACLETQPPVFLCYMVDYGKVLPVCFENIRRIPKRFVSFLPYQAATCVLKEMANVEPENISEKVVARVAELLPENKVVDATVVSFDGDVYVVDIPTVSSVLKKEGLI